MVVTPVFQRATVADIPDMSRIRLAVRENRLRDPGRVTPRMYEDFLERDGRGWVARADLFYARQGWARGDAGPADVRYTLARPPP